jgi:hypothetical protein
MMSLAKVAGLISLTICLAVLLVSRVRNFFEPSYMDMELHLGLHLFRKGQLWRMMTDGNHTSSLLLTLHFFFKQPNSPDVLLDSLPQYQVGEPFTHFCTFHGGLFACCVDVWANQCGISLQVSTSATQLPQYKVHGNIGVPSVTGINIAPVGGATFGVTS